MNDTTENPKLATIRRLLDLADESSGTSDAERELASQRAAALMAKYAVTEAMLDAGRHREDDPVESLVITVDAVYPLQKAHLMNGIANGLSCKLIRHTGKSDSKLMVYGHRSDLGRVEFLYTSLLMQALDMARSVRDPRIVRPNSSQTRSYRVAWLMGFAHRIEDRMQEGRAEAVAEAGSGAELVLVNRAALALRAARTAVPRTRSSSTSVRNNGGYEAGHAAAGRADLGHARVGGARRAIAG